MEHGLPSSQSAGLVMFGSGSYRQSNVYLAFQPEVEINTQTGIRYWTGLDSSGRPIWSANEEKSKPLVNQPCVGEFSVSFNRFIRKWIMLYFTMSTWNPYAVVLMKASLRVEPN